MARRLSALVGFVGLASAVALLSAPPAVAAPTQEQTITFTSTAPEGVNWFGNGHGSFPDAGASASASSGLPVTYSIDPASADVCEIVDDWSTPSVAAINYLGSGTCTIHADQAGNDEYLPADQVSQSFFIDKVLPTLVVLRQKNWPGRKRTFRATLVVPAAWNHWGWLENRVVTFSVGGRQVCSGTTNAWPSADAGVATCTATLSLKDSLRYAFVASFAGDDRYKPVSRTGPTRGDQDPVLNEPW
jgi:hypothetical protein